MNDEELQQRLRRIDHTDRASIDPVTGPRAAALMEQIMNTPFSTQIDPTSTDHEPAAVRRTPRRWAPLLFAGAAALALGVGALAVLGGDDSGDDVTSVAYSLGEPVDITMTMCLPVTDYVPGPGLVGFRGVVTAATETTVTLDVSKWYAGGDADVVELSTVGVGIPALDGVEFLVGGDYLVTVLDGQVLTCGLSGPAEPVLEGLFDSWFAA